MYSRSDWYRQADGDGIGRRQTEGKVDIGCGIGIDST